MNELIEEFSTEAWQYADLHSSNGDNKHGNLYRDKFAELILQHCFDSMHRLEQDIPNIWKVEYDIKSDFGIKL